MTLGYAVSSFVLGRWGDKRGHRVGMLVGVSCQVAALAVVLASSGTVSCVLVYAATGIARGASMVSGYNMMFETCPHDSRMAHITVGNLFLSAANIGSPLLAGLAASHLGLTPLFSVCLGFSVVAFLWFVLRVREPRTLPVYAASNDEGQ
jgi:MFS family permease